MKQFIFLFTFFCFSGCIGIQIDKSVNEYVKIADQIELGDSKDKALAILKPTQKSLPGTARKSPDKYIKDGVLVEIFYIRSGRQPDGLRTDDEFTPYIFNDGKLVAIGWAAIGGPKSQGQVIQMPPVNIQHQTVIH